MMKCQKFIICASLVLLVACIPYISSEKADTKAEEVDADPEKIEYAKGSVCKYCDYCKFCKLCDNDCPCETSEEKPNCDMCKYCKFCHICKVCDSICTAGGILDKVSSAIVNALPSHDTNEIDNDISKVQTWIDKKKDEL